MNTQNRVDFRGKTQVSLDGVKCTPEHHERPRTTVDARPLLALAAAWEECAELDLANAEICRRHADALRGLVSAVGVTVQP